MYRHTVQRILACKAAQHSAILRRFYILDRPLFSLCALAGSVGDKNGRNLGQKPYQLHLHITAGPGHLLILMIFMTSAQTRQQHTPQQTSQIYVTSCCLDGEGSASPWQNWRTTDSHRCFACLIYTCRSLPNRTKFTYLQSTD